MTRDPRIDAYIERAAPFARPILAHARALVHQACPQVEETIKWGMPTFVHAGGILCGIGWAINAHAETLNGYYLGMIIAGIGAGGVYGTCVGNALKWFPDKRGLAAGITAAGFGAGSALTVAPIQAMIKDSGFQTTFLYFGLGQGVIIVLLAFLLAMNGLAIYLRNKFERRW